MNRLLVIEDEDVIRKQLARLLERNRFQVETAATVELALELDPESFDLILADIRLPGASGTEIVKLAADVPVIIMTSYASVRSAVESMKLGAVDYISKPFDHDELLMTIERSLRENRLTAQNAAMRRDLHRIFPHEEITTQNTELQNVITDLAALSEKENCVYLYGERGTGKELIARLCHETGQRAAGPLIFADLPMYGVDQMEALLFGATRAPQADHSLGQPRLGLLHAAHTGTIILRNAGLLPIPVQQRLAEHFSQPVGSNQATTSARLVVLETDYPKQFFDASQMDADFVGLFEQCCFALPPLRQRREDIEALALYYIGIFERRYRKRVITLIPESLNVLQAYHWPGNVSELKSIIERAVLMVDADELRPVHLGLGVMNRNADQIQMDLSLDGYFRYFVLSYQDSLSETELAAKLGISRKALWERRQKMNLPRQV